MVVSPQADVKYITNQKAIQNQTTSYSRMSDKSATTVEIPTLSQWRHQGAGESSCPQDSGSSSLGKPLQPRAGTGWPEAS